MKLVNLELIRKERNLTRKDLEKLSGVSQFTIQALEEGRYDIDNIKLSTLLALASALHIKAKKLLPFDLAKKI